MDSKNNNKRLKPSNEEEVEEKEEEATAATATAAASGPPRPAHYFVNKNKNVVDPATTTSRRNNSQRKNPPPIINNNNDHQNNNNVESTATSSSLETPMAMMTTTMNNATGTAIGDNTTNSHKTTSSSSSSSSSLISTKEEKELAKCSSSQTTLQRHRTTVSCISSTCIGSDIITTSGGSMHSAADHDTNDRDQQILNNNNMDETEEVEADNNNNNNNSDNHRLDQSRGRGGGGRRRHRAIIRRVSTKQRQQQRRPLRNCISYSPIRQTRISHRVVPTTNNNLRTPLPPTNNMMSHGYRIPASSNVLLDDNDDDHEEEEEGEEDDDEEYSRFLRHIRHSSRNYNQNHHHNNSPRKRDLIQRSRSYSPAAPSTTGLTTRQQPPTNNNNNHNDSPITSRRRQQSPSRCTTDNRRQRQSPTRCNTTDLSNGNRNGGTTTFGDRRRRQSPTRCTTGGPNNSNSKNNNNGRAIRGRRQSPTRCTTDSPSMGGTIRGGGGGGGGPSTVTSRRRSPVRCISDIPNTNTTAELASRGRRPPILQQQLQDTSSSDRHISSSPSNNHNNIHQQGPVIISDIPSNPTTATGLPSKLTREEKEQAKLRQHQEFSDSGADRYGVVAQIIAQEATMTADEQEQQQQEESKQEEEVVDRHAATKMSPSVTSACSLDTMSAMSSNFVAPFPPPSSPSSATGHQPLTPLTHLATEKQLESDAPICNEPTAVAPGAVRVAGLDGHDADGSGEVQGETGHRDTTARSSVRSSALTMSTLSANSQLTALCEARDLEAAIRSSLKERSSTSSSIKRTLSGNFLIEAFPVEDSNEHDAHDHHSDHQSLSASIISRIEHEIRDRIMMEAVEAQATSVHSDDGSVKSHGSDISIRSLVSYAKQRKSIAIILALFCLMMMAIVGLSVGLAVGLSKRSGGNNTNEREVATMSTNVNVNSIDAPLISTLEMVQGRGYIICGHSDFGFVSPADTGNAHGDIYQGLNVEQCKAMALLALGDATKYKQVQVDLFTRWTMLADKTIDVLFEGSSHTMERDIHLDISDSGFTFTVPYMYSGLTFGGNPTFVDCADKLDDFYGPCRELKICVADGSTHVDVLQNLLSGSDIVTYNETNKLATNLNNGACNVVAADPLYLGKLRHYYEGEWMTSSNFFSKEPLAFVTREDDPEWSNLANLIVNTFILAEANNISKSNAEDMALLLGNADGESTTGNFSAFEYDLVSKMVSLVENFGHYDDLYQKYIAFLPQRHIMNNVYDRYQSTGLLYSFPIGNSKVSSPDPAPNSLLHQVKKNTYLTCGIMSSRGSGFAYQLRSNATLTSIQDAALNWEGFDVEFCKALSASLFQGSKHNVRFVEIDDMNDAYLALAAGDVDLVAGARVTIQADYNEPITGQGYTFSTPYFYDNESLDAFAFMTREDDAKWSDFVYWIVMATIYAEEGGISLTNSGDMPVVTLFGDVFKQMLRDCIAAVGSYADIYRNTLESYIPRAGANQLNENPRGPQLFPIPPV